MVFIHVTQHTMLLLQLKLFIDLNNNYKYNTYLQFHIFQFDATVFLIYMNKTTLIPIKYLFH